MKFSDFISAANWRAHEVKDIWLDIECPALPPGFAWTIYYRDPAIQKKGIATHVAWINERGGQDFELVRASDLGGTVFLLINITPEEAVNALSMNLWMGNYGKL